VAEDERAPGTNVVDVFAAVDVYDARAAGTIDDERFPTDCAKRTDGTIDAAYQDFLRASEEIVGCGHGRLFYVMTDAEARKSVCEEVAREW
jgi:hypothetical protein